MKIGFISLPLSGHINPFLALARTLKARGHQPIYFGVPDCASAVGAAGIDFVPYGQEEFPVGAVAKTWGPIASLQGIEVLEYALKQIHVRFLDVALQHLPAAVQQSGVEAMIMDPIFLFGELVPMSLHLPYLQVCPILPMDPTPTTPPSAFRWPLQDSSEARERNLKGLQQIGSYVAAAAPVAAAYAAKMGLAIDLHDPGATASKLAAIAACPKEFDFPGIPWPPTFHYAGPMVDDAGRAPVPFDWSQLDGRPLIYASLGTLNNGRVSTQKTILAAVARLPDYQVVFSIGHTVNPADLGPVPKNVILVPSAPQVELLKRVALCITHAGLNTTLESLAAGVPLVAIPIGYDQPGIAVRIAYHGVGEFVEADNLSADSLLHQLETVLNTPSYRQKANAFRETLEKTDGKKIAADLIEEALATHA